MVLIPSPDAKENDPTQVFYEIEGQRILIASLRSEKSRAVSLPLFLAPGNWQAIQVRGTPFTSLPNRSQVKALFILQGTRAKLQ